MVAIGAPSSLQKFRRCLDVKSRELEFAPDKVAGVGSDDTFCSPCNRQFDHMIVSFIGQVGSPKVRDGDPFTNREKSFDQFLTLPAVQGRAIQTSAPGQIAVFMEQLLAHEGLVLPIETKPQNGSAGPSATEHP